MDPGPHREPRRTVGSILAAFLPSVLSVLVVAALITGLYVWRGTGDQRSTAVADRSSERSPTASQAPESAPTGTRAATPGPTVTGPATIRPPSTAPSSGPEQDYQVVVLNQDAPAGLAATVGAMLRDQGWDVYSEGDFFGTVVATTVYYPPGARRAARALAADLPVPRRVLPRFGNLSVTRLTVVLTASYPG